MSGGDSVSGENRIYNAASACTTRYLETCTTLFQSQMVETVRQEWQFLPLVAPTLSILGLYTANVSDQLVAKTLLLSNYVNQQHLYLDNGMATFESI